MACIKPFRGVRYNLKKIGDLERVVTPPYDVITPEQQEAFYKKSPYNIVKLDFGKTYDHDNQANNRYTRASRDFEAWQKEGIFLRDNQPAIYIYQVTYTVHGGRVFTRKGFFSVVRLEEFSSGIVKPHEKTFPKVTCDRLQLMEHCGANFSPVFSLYSDPQNAVMDILEKHKEEPLLASFYDWAGLKHEMWAVRNHRAIVDIQRILSKETVFIADGHHRYTTALEYRRAMQARYPECDERHAFNYIMMYLCSMEDEGLAILPTHRLVTCEDVISEEEFIREAMQYFKVEKISFKERTYAGQAEEALGVLKGGECNRPAIGLYTGDNNCFYLLRLKEGTMQAVFGGEMADPLLELDVVVLTELVFDRLMGLKHKNNAAGDIVRYYHNAREAMEAAGGDKKTWAFLLNPTRIEQVRNVAMAGLVMPHKSTYFYPKILTGLVLNKIVPKEEV